MSRETAGAPEDWSVYQHPDTPWIERYDVVGKTRDDDVAENILGLERALLIAAAPRMLSALGAIAANPRADSEDRNAALAAIAKATAQRANP